MLVTESVLAVRGWREEERQRGRRIALVPTMGFLHEGHLQLVRAAKKSAERVVVSIFVNPAQFSAGEDFGAYPRDVERDRQVLEAEGIDLLFQPPVAEIYPAGFETYVNVENLSLPLCGVFRPGHFRGVATVVAKLFNIVRPHVAVFGCKDYQQLQIIRRMVRDLNFDVEILGLPTAREPDGLAMSSRNAYLGPAERVAALAIVRGLRMAEAMVGEGETRSAMIVRTVRDEIAKQPGTSVEYVSLCDPETLREVDEVRGAAVLAVAARLGNARLIDNIILRLKER